MGLRSLSNSITVDLMATGKIEDTENLTSNATADFPYGGLFHTNSLKHQAPPWEYLFCYLGAVNNNDYGHTIVGKNEHRLGALCCVFVPFSTSTAQICFVSLIMNVLFSPSLCPQSLKDYFLLVRNKSKIGFIVFLLSSLPPNVHIGAIRSSLPCFCLPFLCIYLLDQY